MNTVNTFRFSFVEKTINETPVNVFLKSEEELDNQFSGNGIKNDEDYEKNFYLALYGNRIIKLEENY